MDKIILTGVKRSFSIQFISNHEHFIIGQNFLSRTILILSMTKIILSVQMDGVVVHFRHLNCFGKSVAFLKKIKKNFRTKIAKIDHSAVSCLLLLLGLREKRLRGNSQPHFENSDLLSKKEYFLNLPDLYQLEGVPD